MEDYRIEFQSVVDALSIYELEDFYNALGTELSKRIAERKAILEEELKGIKKVEEGRFFYEDYYFSKESSRIRSELEQNLKDNSLDSSKNIDNER